MANVKFISVQLKSTFLALESKDPLALYWIVETSELFKGDQLFGTGALVTEQTAGLLSPEDYASLKALVASGGNINDLRPVDASIIITKEGNGATVGIGLSAVNGNMLSIKDDGLYVAETKVPEFTVEKQSIAEDGFAATYKLKRTFDGISTYVGDSINIFKDLMINKGSLETVVTDGVPYDSAIAGDPYIDLVLNDTEASHIYIPVKGLVDVYTAGSGIVIENGVVSVKLANDTSGLHFVDGVLDLNLATRKVDGAMSKEDKLIVDSIPYAYVARKYDISDTPTGTLVNYGEREIRVMVPAGAEFTKQNVGAGGDANSYYMTLKTYASNDKAVGYIEHINGQSDSEILTDLSVDEYGRRYQNTWLAVSKFDEATNTWTYYGENSAESHYIGFDYQIDWYDANNKIVASDCVRINLSNEACHNNNKPYYMANFATSDEIAEIRESIADMEEFCTWNEM